MNPHHPLFRIEDLTFRYRKRAEPVLRGISLDILAGAPTAIVGLSASGKSTLLGLLGRIVEKASEAGSISYFPASSRNANGTSSLVEVSYARLSASQGAQLRAKDFGFVFQSSYLLPNVTCRRNVELPLMLRGYGLAFRDERVERLLAELERGTGVLNDLRDALNKLPGEVSGGQRQRVALLRAMIHDPAVLFADEPSASLDPYWSERVQGMLRAWIPTSTADEPKTVILVTHQLADAIDLIRRGPDDSGRLISLRDGRVVGGRPLTADEISGGAEQIKSWIIDGERAAERLSDTEPSALGEAR